MPILSNCISFFHSRMESMMIYHNHNSTTEWHLNLGRESWDYTEKYDTTSLGYECIGIQGEIINLVGMSRL